MPPKKVVFSWIKIKSFFKTLSDFYKYYRRLAYSIRHFE
jgi:hypothetical protein